MNTTAAMTYDQYVHLLRAHPPTTVTELGYKRTVCAACGAEGRSCIAEEREAAANSGIDTLAAFDEATRLGPLFRSASSADLDAEDSTR